jgi:hypothetical protein
MPAAPGKLWTGVFLFAQIRPKANKKPSLVSREGKCSCCFLLLDMLVCGSKQFQSRKHSNTSGDVPRAFDGLPLRTTHSPDRSWLIIVLSLDSITFVHLCDEGTT